MLKDHITITMIFEPDKQDRMLAGLKKHLIKAE